MQHAVFIAYNNASCAATDFGESCDDFATSVISNTFSSFTAAVPGALAVEMLQFLGDLAIVLDFARLYKGSAIITYKVYLCGKFVCSYDICVLKV